MKYKLYVQFCSDDETELHSTYDTEESASKAARDGYERGWRSVEVIKPDGTESMVWCKAQVRGES